MSERPRLLLVPEFTELTWTIRPRLEEWADVASFDPPGIGDEPPGELSAEAMVARAIAEVEGRGWETFFVAGDHWSNPVAAYVARAAPERVLGVALGHAALSTRRSGDRPPVSPEVYAALDQLIQQDAEAFIRHGIVQATRGSVDEELAAEMLARVPPELMGPGWQLLTEERDFAAELRSADVPLLLGRHRECLMSTQEGFDDAVAAFPDAQVVVTEFACSSDPQFAAALREFCMRIVAARARA